MLNTPKIVRFRDGNFGLRRLAIDGYEYLDLVAARRTFWWSRFDYNFKDCRGDLDTVKRALDIICDEGTLWRKE